MRRPFMEILKKENARVEFEITPATAAAAGGGSVAAVVFADTLAPLSRSVEIDAIAWEVPAIVQALPPQPQQHHTRIASLFARMRTLCDDSVFSESHTSLLSAAASALDELVATVIERATALRAQQRPKQEKKLALTDLLRHMESPLGLSYHQADFAKV